MKIKLGLISGIGVILSIIIWFSPLEMYSQVNKHLSQGNEFLELSDLENGSTEYLDGLVLAKIKEGSLVKTQDRLNTNLAITMFLSERYTEIEEYLLDIESHYLLRGNAYYYISEIESDPNAKLEALNNALNMYREGILLDSHDLELKYNYEFVLDKLETEEEQQEQEQNEDSEENSEDEDQENQDGDQEESSEGDKSEESEDKQDGGNQDQSQEDGESQEEQDSSLSEEDENSDNQDQEGQSGPENQDQEGQEGPEQAAGEPLQGELTEEAYEELLRILELLEQQEEESLKNNQEVIQEGNGDTNDW